MLCTQIVVFVLLTFRTILVHNMFCRCCELLKNIYLYHISLFSRTLWKILPLCMVNIQERFIIKSELWWRAYSIHFPQYWMITCSSDQTTNPESANSEFFLQSKYFSLPLQKVKSIIETHFREKKFMICTTVDSYLVVRSDEKYWNQILFLTLRFYQIYAINACCQNEQNFWFHFESISR